MHHTMKAWTGLFIGAGFSYEAGMPLVWELTEELKVWLSIGKLKELNESWKAQGGGQSDAVLADFVSVLERKDLHYEAVLGYLAAQARRQRALGREYHWLYSWLVQMVYYLLYYRQINNRGFLEANLPHYDGIRALADDNAPLRIFSLNHDVIVEAIAARLGIKLHTGFSAETIALPLRNCMGLKTGEIRAKVLTKDTLDNHAMYFPNPPEPGIYLFKIHGALDIFAFNDGNDLLKLVPDEEGLGAVLRVLHDANENLFYPEPASPRGRANIMNEIAFADDKGVMQFLRRSLLAGAHKFDSRHSQTLPMSMMKHFQANINFVTHLVSIGYGFGDLHINLAIREWLEFASDRTLEIVSPAAKDVPQFLLHLAPQVRITPQSATAFLDAKAGIVRPLRQRIEKRLRDTLRSLRKDPDAAEQGSPGALMQGKMFLMIVNWLENLPEVDIFAEDGPIALAEREAKEARLTQGGLLNRLRTGINKHHHP